MAYSRRIHQTMAAQSYIRHPVSVATFDTYMCLAAKGFQSPILIRQIGCMTADLFLTTPCRFQPNARL